MTSRTLAEQRAAADLLLSGHPDQRGLRQAVEDAQMEDVLERLERLAVLAWRDAREGCR